jgi:glycosyltransferase involved in cell wall biosynthesis
MRILHVPYSFFPDPAGGTEVYVDALVSWQRSFGCDAAVAAPASSKTRYDHAGIPVWRFPVSPNLGLRDLYGEGDQVAAEGFGAVLDDFRPEVVHLHALTSAISVRLAEQAAERDVPIVLNYHTPTVSCSRGTLLKWGAEICDGRLGRFLCTSCTLHGSGLPRPLATLVATLPPSACGRLGHAGLSGGVWTALRMPELIDIRIRAFHRLMQMVDRVIALCNWTRELLIRNGVPRNKITLCRQGISWSSNDFRPGLAPHVSGLPLRAAFLGRLDSTKGVHVVLEALKNNAELSLRLDVFGIRQGDSGNRYAADLQTMIANDSRIRILPPLLPGDVVSRLREYDLLVIPSQWLETGPLVVLEAFASGIPVIGSNLGGIAELVADGVDGLLVTPAASPAAWADVFRRVCLNPKLLDLLRAGIRPPRHARQAALEIMPLYEEVVHNQKRNLVGDGVYRLGLSV